MASQAELIGQLQAMDPSQLMGRLATTEGRTQLSDLDRAAGANCKIIAAAIAAVPASEFAAREDLQEIFDEFLNTRHQEIINAISDKICEFDIDQTNAHPWLRDWAHNQQYDKSRRSIYESEDAFKNIGDHLRETEVRTQARAFFGKDIEEMSQQSFRDEIQAMDPTVLLEKLAYPAGRQELYGLNACRTQEYDLVGFALATIPADQLAAHPNAEQIVIGLLSERGKHINTLRAAADKISEFNVDQTNAHPWIKDITTDSKMREIYDASDPLSQIGRHLNTVTAFNTAAIFVGRPVAGISNTELTSEIGAMDPKEILAGLMDPERLRALSQMGSRSQDGGQLIAHAITQVPPELWPKGPELVETLSSLMKTRNPTVLAAIVAKIEKLPDATLLAQDDKSNQFWNRLVEWGFSSDVASASSATRSNNPVVSAIQKVTGAARDRANQESFFGNDPTVPTVTGPPLGDR